MKTSFICGLCCAEEDIPEDANVDKLRQLDSVIMLGIDCIEVGD